MARWKVTLHTALPKTVRVVSAADGSLPGPLQWSDPVEATMTVGDFSGVQISLNADSLIPAPRDWQGITIDAIVEDADAPFDAALAAMPLVDLVLDDLAFLLQRPLSWGQTDVVEVVEAGQSAQMLLSPGGLDMVSRSQSKRTEFPHLRLKDGKISLKVRRALRFYNAAMGVPEGEEAFLLYWTALEHLFSEDGLEVKEPATIHGHYVVDPCPECGKSTMQVRQRRSLEAYLVAIGATQAQAAALYDLRQVAHGRTPDDTLFTHVGLLKALVGVTLAGQLNISPNVVQQRPAQALWAEGFISNSPTVESPPQTTGSNSR